MNRIRICVVTAALLVAAPHPARADVYLAALFGAAAGGALDGSKTTYAGQLGILGAGMLGIEGDYGFTTKTKHGEGGDNFRTLMGSVLIAPLKIGSEKFRPYFAAGGGVISGASKIQHLFVPDDTVQSAAIVNAGGGVFAFLSNQIGVRLDARYMRLLLDADPELGSEASPNFIRVAGGLVVRF